MQCLFHTQVWKQELAQALTTPGRKESIKIYTGSCLSGTPAMSRQRCQPAPSSLWEGCLLLAHLVNDQNPLQWQGSQGFNSTLRCFPKHTPGSLDALGKSFPGPQPPSDSTSTRRSVSSQSLQEFCGGNYPLCIWQCWTFKNIALLSLVLFQVLFFWRAFPKRNTECS